MASVRAEGRSGGGGEGGQEHCGGEKSLRCAGGLRACEAAAGTEGHAAGSRTGATSLRWEASVGASADQHLALVQSSHACRAEHRAGGRAGSCWKLRGSCREAYASLRAATPAHGGRGQWRRGCGGSGGEWCTPERGAALQGRRRAGGGAGGAHGGEGEQRQGEQPRAAHTTAGGTERGEHAYAAGPPLTRQHLALEELQGRAATGGDVAHLWWVVGVRGERQVEKPGEGARRGEGPIAGPRAWAHCRQRGVSLRRPCALQHGLLRGAGTRAAQPSAQMYPRRTFSATPAFSTAATESPPPMMVMQSSMPASSLAMAKVPLEKASNSNTARVGKQAGGQAVRRGGRHSGRWRGGHPASCWCAAQGRQHRVGPLW